MDRAKVLLIVGFVVGGVAATLTSNHIRGKGQDHTRPGAPAFPAVINTWAQNGFESAGAKAWEVLSERGTALDAVERGCTLCEKLQCDGTVGFGGSPDEDGETTLDAMIMDGVSMNIGAVSDLRRIPNAISVARKVLDHTAHTMLAGDQATKFAMQLGFKQQSLSTNKSLEIWTQWKRKHCQPNFWRNVSPDPRSSCGPYKVLAKKSRMESVRSSNEINSQNHDTIGMVAIDANGLIAAGTSTNGARHKIPGRVGDSPIPGAGAYADQDVGGAAATGDGDVMMRFLPSFLAVEEMRRGQSPKQAAETAMRRIVAKYPEFQGAMVVLRKDGQHAAVCHGLSTFPYTFANNSTGKATVYHVDCL
ncbi:N(4)-(Beta-N-acetylglucosaminyl)-L-asparaginase-like [Frankliniella occidentalis]|uniref:N(4)-(beta-N-acetylglucosaminyl)-L-asparaginase n=1 Tax=Frankliniella occidentalis TaxID=133901 RepID=A0A9C6XSD9_FRAOC|nr:N(4)-(Beta-N-acetylglucosaminyl)-L-asparaginase-like [Frankliniella occidentalis]